MVIDLKMFCPRETSPKSVVVLPLSDITTIEGFTVGQWSSKYNVLWILKKI